MMFLSVAAMNVPIAPPPIKKSARGRTPRAASAKKKRFAKSFLRT